MKNQSFWFAAILIVGILCHCSCPQEPEPMFTHHGPSDKIEQIKINLWNNSPNYGSPEIRELILLELDELLLDPSSYGSTKSFEFYTSMIQKVSEEIDDEVISGIRIWMMYNHGFIVKTPHNTFAFDLTDGYTAWQMDESYEIPEQIVKNIDFLLISHKHDDHYDESIINKVLDYGGQVINVIDNRPMYIDGISIAAHNGVHSVVNRIFEIITVDGYKIVHTGDNETSEALPFIADVDVLLLYAKTNESFTTYSSVGMRNSINKLTPTITIPGHIHEFGHKADVRALDSGVRALYKWSFFITNEWIPTTMTIMAWGEYFDFMK